MTALVRRTTLILLFVVMLLNAVRSLAAIETEPPAALAGFSSEQALRLGERMYREGILPSGEKMRAEVKGGFAASGSAAACVLCHLKSGMGSPAKRTMTKPITGSKLYAPLQTVKLQEVSETLSGSPVYRSETLRPAYSNDSLARAIRTGEDPNGYPLDVRMPKYPLADGDMNIMINYLKHLSPDRSPGATARTMRFATVVSDAVSFGDRASMIELLRIFTKNWAKSHASRGRRALSLAVWELKGPSDTWREQLEEYYRKDPVFALVGGLTNTEWAPIHHFCEEHRIPSILPLTDQPVISEQDWYTLYFSKGLAQEGETAAGYLQNRPDLRQDGPVLQVYREGSKGLALSRAFKQAWEASGRRSPLQAIVGPGEAVTEAYWKDLIDRHQPSAIMAWLEPKDLQGISSLARERNSPQVVMVSAGLIGPSQLNLLPAKARKIVHITYPYALPKDSQAFAASAASWMGGYQVHAQNQEIALRTFGMLNLLSASLRMMGTEASRDYFLETFDMLSAGEGRNQAYPQLSFGPGKRYAAEDGYVVQLSDDAQPQLIIRSRVKKENDRDPAGLSHDDTLRLGERMYREGILPSGDPMLAVVKGDIPVDGQMFSCVSCHQRSGIGALEGRVLTKPVNGRKLYEPLYTLDLLRSNSQMVTPGSWKGPLLRPAYTDESLAWVMQAGNDSAGRQLDDVMPMYLLDDSDMNIMINYLKHLSSGTEPGITARTMRLATVVSETTPAGDRMSMLEPLQAFVKTWARQDMNMYSGTRLLSLAVWELKGPSDTWRAQLEEYYRKDPVFALVGGLTNTEWAPIHHFCEEHRIPSILPLTDQPVISEQDWYTLYFSKGLAQEGETAAGYLQNRPDLRQDGPVLQVYREGSKGLALSRAFKQAWEASGRRSPLQAIVGPGEAVTEAYWKDLIDRHQPSAIMAWLEPKDLQGISSLARERNSPQVVMVSAGLIGPSQLNMLLPTDAKKIVHITYPYALPRDSRAFAEAVDEWMKIYEVRVSNREIATRTFSLINMLTSPLMMMGNDVYRDYFLELFDMLPDLGSRNQVYTRLSFGPGQRYAAKGCYVVQLTDSLNPEFVVRGEWAMQ